MSLEVGAGAIRLSLGRMTTHDELETLVERLAEVVPSRGVSASGSRTGCASAPSSRPTSCRSTRPSPKRSGVASGSRPSCSSRPTTRPARETRTRSASSAASPTSSSSAGASRRRSRSPRRCSRALATAAGPSTSPTSSSTATARSPRSSTCEATPGPTTSRSRTRDTASRATTWSRSARRTASSARSSRPAFTRRRCAWWQPARSTPPPSTPRCWPWRMRDDPSLARSLRIIDALGPSTIQPVAVSKRVPPRLRAAIQEVLTTMHEDPAMRERLALGMVERFVPASPSSYDDIRMMRDSLRGRGVHGDPLTGTAAITAGRGAQAGLPQEAQPDVSPVPAAAIALAAVVIDAVAAPHREPPSARRPSATPDGTPPPRRVRRVATPDRRTRRRTARTTSIRGEVPRHVRRPVRAEEDREQATATAIVTAAPASTARARGDAPRLSTSATAAQVAAAAVAWPLGNEGPDKTCSGGMSGRMRSTATLTRFASTSWPPSTTTKNRVTFQRPPPSPRVDGRRHGGRDHAGRAAGERDPAEHRQREVGRVSRGPARDRHVHAHHAGVGADHRDHHAEHDEDDDDPAERQRQAESRRRLRVEAGTQEPPHAAVLRHLAAELSRSDAGRIGMRKRRDDEAPCHADRETHRRCDEELDHGPPRRPPGAGPRPIGCNTQSFTRLR